MTTQCNATKLTFHELGSIRSRGGTEHEEGR